MDHDPLVTDPDLYRLVMENERVRVLEYRDRPADRTRRHRHPDSVMVTLSSFRRRLHGPDEPIDLELEAGTTRWLAAQEHVGENIGETDTVVLFIELKEPRRGGEPDKPQLGPATR
jgi:hypothetical protein